MENSLPSGWTESQLINLLEALESGSRPKGGVRGITSGIPSIGGEHLNDEGGFDFSNIKFVPESFAHGMTKGKISTGDIFIVKDGATTGKTSDVSKDFPHKTAFVNEHVFICRTIQRLDSKYLYWYLRSKEGNERMMENFKGSAQGGINQSFASNTLVPIAPLPEQQRIVAKLDELMAKIERSRARLERIPQILKRFRQSVLSAAVSGKLTEEWRESNDIGDEWEEIKLGDSVEVIGGFAYKSQTFIDRGNNQVLRIGNVKPYNICLDYSPVFISDLVAQETTRFEVKENDLLISMTGTKYKRDYGYACIVRNFEGRFFINQRVSIIRCKGKINPDFLLHWLQTDYFKNQFFSGETGNVNQGNVGMNGIKDSIIKLPTQQEQERISVITTELFELINKIEARYITAKARLDKLPQSLLAKAFRGELVPQDENDEPASVLLGRIKGEEAGT